MLLDITNPSTSKNIDGKPLTQLELTRLPSDDTPLADQALREVARPRRRRSDAGRDEDLGRFGARGRREAQAPLEQPREPERRCWLESRRCAGLILWCRFPIIVAPLFTSHLSGRQMLPEIQAARRAFSKASRQPLPEIY